MNDVRTIDTELLQARKRLLEDQEGVFELRPIPTIALKINQVCQKPDVDASELAKLVECDAVFSAKILRVANSSIYGCTREICSIQQALVVLGRKSIANVATTIAVQQMFRGQSLNPALASIQKKFFNHSIHCGAVARALIDAGEFDVDVGAAVLAASMHDIGKLFFLDLAPIAYMAMYNKKSLSGDQRREAELEMFGTDHCQIGTALARSWELPSSICEVVEKHHCEDLDQCQPMTQLIGLANRLSKIWHNPFGSNEVKSDFPWCESVTEEFLDDLEQSAARYFAEAKPLISS